MNTKLDVDSDGNPLNPPDVSTDAGTALYLLEYARVRGFRIGPAIQVGSVTFQVQDLRQTADVKRQAEAPESNIWADHGHTE